VVNAVGAIRNSFLQRHMDDERLNSGKLHLEGPAALVRSHFWRKKTRRLNIISRTTRTRV
jgi:hypothetical protein